MAAAKKNEYWKLRSSHGRNPIFSSPDQLESACYEYFKWVESNPLIEEKVFHANGRITRVKCKKLRPMTKSGLCLFLDISDDSWSNYKKNKDFLGICESIERTIYNQKLAGATADLMNPAIIARELGLADKVDNNHSGKLDLNIVDYSNLSNQPPKNGQN